MCGIAGIVGASEPLDEGILAEMRDVLAHRGPDDFGVWTSPARDTGLAHRRLAIVDLTDRGHQPMSDAEERYWLVFNGEIYNYRELRDELRRLGWRFKSDTDTEVILHAYAQWGVECLKRLEGMFAFAIYDSTERTIFLARDRAGEKPLFYSIAGSTLMFASELKSLMKIPTLEPVVDLEAFSHYLTYGFVPGEMCILRGVRKLPAASACLFDARSGAYKVWQYWELPQQISSSASMEELASRLEELLEASVRRQLVADVPVGVLLSGGLDSSLVAAMAVRASRGPVTTFTVSFPGSGSFDEAQYAREIADFLDTEHVELDGSSMDVGSLRELAWQFDEPMADSSMVPTLMVSRLIRQHAKVALGGDGGDELFGGYASYSRIYHQNRLGRFVPRALLEGPLRGLACRMPPGVKGRNFLLGATAPEPLRAAFQGLIFFDPEMRSQILHRDVWEQVAGFVPELYKSEIAGSRSGSIDRATVTDFKTYLPDDILVKVDRASMLASLEVRAPWLDREIVEFAFGSVSDALKVRGFRRKLVPAALARRVLPPSYDVRRKQGFSIPFEKWFKGQWGDFVKEVLMDTASSPFSSPGIANLLEGAQRGRSNSARIFCLTMFELWRRRYSVSFR